MKIIHELINLGKGKYGNGHTQIEVADLLKIYDQREASTSTGGSGGGITITTEGHIILDGNASIMTQQPNLRFNRMIVTNDNVNQQTIVTRPPSIILSTTPPLNPLQGDEWINSNTWKTYVYYDSYWVEQSRTGLGDQLFKPVLNSYTTQSLMIAGQGSQISGYLYYDGTSYWEYLGTINGNISDYRKIGGSVTPGLGLSLDSLNRIQLGTEDYTGNRTILFDEWENAGYSEFIIRNTDNSNSLILFNNSTSKGLYYNSFLTGGNDFVELSVGTGQVYLSKAIIESSVQKTQLLIFDTAIQNNKIIFRDDINLKGVEYHADYEANFTARSLVTKQYVDNSISGSTGGGHTIKSNGTPLTQRTGLNFSTSFIVTDDSVNNETDVTIDTNIIATRSYVDESKLYQLVTFSSVILMTGNFKSVHTQIAPIAYTRTNNSPTTNFENKTIHYISANGTGGKPTFSADFVIQKDTWLNTVGSLNRLTFVTSPSGKILVWMENIE